MLESNDKYFEVLNDIKKTLITTRNKIVENANKDLVLMYYNIGLKLIENNKWGSSFIDTLAKDLKMEFPTLKGMSARNLRYMQKFATEFKNDEFLQGVLAKLSWNHNQILLDKVKDQEIRKWYAKETIENGWSVSILTHQIASKLYERQALLENKTINFDEKLSDEEKTEKLYNLYLVYYKKTGYHPHPANLLALKLLLKRNEFEGLKVEEGTFYNEYKEFIDESIQEVEEDFNINEEEIKSYIEREGLFVIDDDYYHDKIWYVYAEGFGVLHGNLMYTPERNSLDIYSDLDNKNIVFAPYGKNEEKPDISIYDDKYKDTRLKTNRVNYKRLIKSMQSRQYKKTIII